MMNRPKILQVSNNLEARLGGPPVVVRALQGILNRDFEHHLLVFGKSDFSDINFSQIQTKKDNHYGFFLGLIPKKERNFIKASDLILLHGFYLYSNLLILLSCKEKKVVVMPHGTFESYQQKKSPIRKFFFDCIFNFLARNNKLSFVVASQTEIAGVLMKYPNANITVVGIGVDKPPIVNLKRDSNGKLLCLSRIAEKKRIDICIEALHLLRNQENGLYTLSIAGEGNLLLKSRLIAQAESLNVLSSVTFMGLLDGAEKWQVIAESSILLLPSMNENFAISVAECISAGLPVIVSKNVALKDFVQTNECGVVIESLSPENVLKAIQTIETRYSYYVDNCLNSFKHLSWEVVGDKWSETIWEALETP